MKTKKEFVPFYMALEPEVHKYIAELAEKNERTISAQARIMLKKLIKK